MDKTERIIVFFTNIGLSIVVVVFACESAIRNDVYPIVPITIVWWILIVIQHIRRLQTTWPI